MNEIDESLSRRYRAKKRYGELSAIYELAHQSVLNAMKRELSRGLRNERHYSQVIYIDHQWIDKIPLASFVDRQVDINGNPTLGKTEIGDVFIQYRRSSPFINGKNVIISPFDRRALVIQAKIADMAVPIVPIGRISKKKANSTSRELKLLQDWPIFDLYETSRSKVPLKQGIEVDHKGNQFAFFGGFYNGTKKWAFGPARNGASCTFGYGKIIINLANGDLGKSFRGDDGWASLCESISKICRNRYIPKSIAKGVESRNKRVTVKLHCFPSSLIEMIRSIFRKRKMLVILIDQIDYEGSEIIDEILNPSNKLVQ